MATPNIEGYEPFVQQSGLQTQKNITVGGSANLDMSGSTGNFLSPTGTNTFGTKIAGKDLVIGTGYFSVATRTNGLTPVNVFGATAGFTGTFTSVIIISENTVAGLVDLYTTVGTVAEISKLGTLNQVVGTTLTNVGFISTNAVKVVCVPANGSATVVASFITA